jgi:Flp pilus assembly protein TadD
MLPAPQTEPPLEEWTSCSLCQVRSPLKTVFRSSKRKRCLCPACFENEESRFQQGVLFMLAFWVALGAAAALLGGNGNAGWVFLNLALLHVMQWITIIPHEAGHALAARAMGLRVWQIIIGVGRRLGSWRVGSMRFDLHLFPFAGATVTEVRAQPWARLRRLCVVAGGPLANLLLIWGAVEFGREAWIAERVDQGPAPVFIFIVANCLVLLMNLWPTYSGRGPSDGAQLLGLLFLRGPDFADLQRRTTLYRIELAATRGDAAQAVLDARAALREYPRDPTLRVALSAALLNAEHFGEARELLLELLQDPTQTLEIRAILYNNLAFANVNLDDPVLGKEAMSLAAQAYRWMPWAPWASVNLGSAEALFGDCERAVELLSNPRIAAQSPELKAEAASALAFAYARLGQSGASDAALATARAAHPRSHLLALIERRLRGDTRPPQPVYSNAPALQQPADEAST